jgi:multiple sugar transport system permease protein
MEAVGEPALGPFVGLENYVLAVTDDPDLLNSGWVTLVFTVLSVVCTLTVAMALAVLLAGNTRLEINTRTLLVIPFAMSPALVGVSWRFLLNPEFGGFTAIIGAVIPSLKGASFLADPNLAMAALVICDVWHSAPYFMLMFIGALASLPQETIEAAQVDGASKFRLFFEVILPQLKPVLAIAILLKIIFSLKVLDQVITLTNGGPARRRKHSRTSSTRPRSAGIDVGYAAATAYLLAALMAVFAAIYFQLITERRPA